MAKRKQEEQEAPGIVVLYTSLMILLLAFFILLNSISKVEEARVQSAFQSLMGSFGFQPGGQSPLSSDLPKSRVTVTAPINPVDQDWVSLRGMVLSNELSKQVRLLRSDGTKTAVLPDSLLFQPGSEKLSEAGKRFLVKVAAIVKGGGYPITLNGHTDDALPLRADGKSNFTISADRALAVLRFLVGQGVSSQRLAAFGLAGYKPIVPNDSATHRRLNNRVEMVFDARDVSRYKLPGADTDRKLDFRGFVFDLLGVPVDKKKASGGEGDDGAR